MHPQHIAALHGQPLQHRFDPSGQGIGGRPCARHANSPGANDPGSIGQLLELDPPPHRRRCERVGQIQIPVLEVEPLQARACGIDPEGARDIGLAAPTQGFEGETDEPRSPVGVVAQTEAVGVQEGIGEKDGGIGRPVQRFGGMQPRKSLFDKLLGGERNVGRPAVAPLVAPILRDHRAVFAVHLAPDSHHFVAVVAAILRPRRRGQRLARLIPDPGHRQSLFGAHAAAPIGPGLDSGQRDRLDPGDQLQRQGVAGRELEAFREGGGIADPVGAHPVAPRGGGVELKAAIGAGQVLTELALTLIDQHDHGATDRGPASGVQELSAHDLRPAPLRKSRQNRHEKKAKEEM